MVLGDADDCVNVEPGTAVLGGTEGVEWPFWPREFNFAELGDCSTRTMSEFKPGRDRSIWRVVGLLFRLESEGGSSPFGPGLVGGFDNVSTLGIVYELFVCRMVWVLGGIKYIYSRH
jgi:hypothetical protein